jgi:hypothetical protein
LEKGEVLAYAEEVCSKVEPVGIQKVEVAEQEVPIPNIFFNWVSSSANLRGVRLILCFTGRLLSVSIPCWIALNFLKSNSLLANTSSNWASAPVLIRKRCESVRWCVDYRALNALTTKDVFLNAVLEQSAGLIFTCQYAELASSLEYHTFPAKVSRHSFLDDILVLGRDFEGHLANLRAVLVRFREYGLKLKPKKCELFQKEVEFLDRVVGPRGMRRENLIIANNSFRVVQYFCCSGVNIRLPHATALSSPSCI